MGSTDRDTGCGGGRGGIASGAAVDTAQVDKTPLRWTIPRYWQLRRERRLAAVRWHFPPRPKQQWPHHFGGATAVGVWCPSLEQWRLVQGCGVAASLGVGVFVPAVGDRFADCERTGVAVVAFGGVADDAGASAGDRVEQVRRLG